MAGMSRRIQGRVLALAAVVVAAAIVVPLMTIGGRSYTVTAVLPAGDPNLTVGAPVYVDGFPKGTLKAMRVKDNKAVATMEVDPAVGPLHTGASVNVIWKALAGERFLEISNGPRNNPEVPDGGMIPGTFPKPVELNDALNALTPAVRQNLQSLMGRLDTTLQGHQQNLDQTIQEAGPTLSALGNVLRGIGMDGPAIQTLVSETNGLMTKVNSQSQSVQQTIQQLGAATAAIAQQRRELQTALTELPGTLATARSTLAVVPGVTAQTVPLLNDLRPATAELPGVAKRLSPLLTELNPLTGQLKTTLASTSQLLGYTPGLLDSAQGTLPGATQALNGYLTPLQFLRPYAPEAVGFLTTWGSAGQGYDANGHYMRIEGQAGPTSVDDNPGIMPPGVTQNATPAPGHAGGYTPTDAQGQGMH